MSTDIIKNSINTFSNFASDLSSICNEVWENTSLQTQLKKLDDNKIFDLSIRSKILTELKVRPKLLVHIANTAKKAGFKIKNFAEIGTAQGMQSITFSRCFPDSQVYTCDIKDDRDKNFSQYKNIEFVLGDSLALKKKIKESKSSLDFCWIDGAHDHYSVLDDFLSLFSLAHEETIWAFDDFDKRFGCYHDLNILSKHFDEVVVLDLGMTASGCSNRIMLAKGYC
jgi:hypothetical protein